MITTDKLKGNKITINGKEYQIKEWVSKKESNHSLRKIEYSLYDIEGWTFILSKESNVKWGEFLAGHIKKGSHKLSDLLYSRNIVSDEWGSLIDFEAFDDAEMLKSIEECIRSLSFNKLLSSIK